jgi:exosortase J
MTPQETVIPDTFASVHSPIPQINAAMDVNRSRNNRAAIWCGIAFLSALGSVGLYPTLSSLWTVWTSDPLRSLGMLLLPVSLLLVLRAWKQTGWELQGTWWGLVPLALAFLWNLFLVQNVEVRLTFRFALSFLPVSGSSYLYGSGIVLLFGGMRVWRKAWFPLLLLLLLNPIPTTFVSLIDLQLQHIAAHAARMFAIMIGFAPTTPQLLLMFSPKFGMFIAPGCDGVRGAVTMGYIALIAGYLKRLSPVRWALYTIVAVLLGYVLNFIRLCLLVVYYRVAIGHFSLENAARNADYAIGACLWLLASYLFFVLFLGAKSGTRPVVRSAESSRDLSLVLWRGLAFAAMLAIPVVVSGRTLAVHAEKVNESKDLATRMPGRIGEYLLTRTWKEQIDGTIMMLDGAYSKPGTPGEIMLGVWVAGGDHDANDCWRARDQTPQILDAPVLASANGRAIAFDSGFFSDGVTDIALWNARCTPAGCSQVHDLGNSRLGLRLFRGDAGNVLSRTGHTVPMLIKIEREHSTEASKATYGELTVQVQDFVSGLDFSQLSQRFQ